MAWSLSDSGTTAALNVASGETILATDSNNGTFILEVDTSNIVNGDILEIRVYTVTLLGGALVQSYKATYQHAQINNHKISPPIASNQNIKFTVNLTAVASGTRTFVWKVLRV